MQCPLCYIVHFSRGACGAGKSGAVIVTLNDTTTLQQLYIAGW